jgi:hypothetical protein
VSTSGADFEFAPNTGYMLNAVPVDSCLNGFVVAMCSTCTATLAQGFSVVGSAQGSFTVRFLERKFTWIAQALPFIELEIADARCAFLSAFQLGCYGGLQAFACIQACRFRVCQPLPLLYMNRHACRLSVC